MLSVLKIRNIAVIESAEIEFFRGFNVLTGETGAGKSSILDSINAVLGFRTSRELIRTGETQAEVTALFCDIDASSEKALESLGLPLSDDRSLLISRTISADKNVCRINGALTNVAALKTVGATLITIHGQQDNRELLDPETHLSYIDALAGTKELFSKYSEAYSKLVSADAKIKKISSDKAERARRADMLSFQIDELQKANIVPGEWEELKNRRSLMRNYEKIQTAFASAYSALSGGDDFSGALSLVSGAQRELSSVSDCSKDAEKLSERLSEIYYELDDISDVLRGDGFDGGFSQEELNDVEERLDMLYRLSKKYGDTEEEMLAFLENAEKELESVSLSDEMLEELLLKREKLYGNAKSLAEELSKKRKSAAETFCESVCKELRFLDMPSVRFEAVFKDVPLSENGVDSAEFLISANVGEDLKPLAKTASGGELSRIMLAIKNVLSDKDNVNTLVFDEIDTGVSGRAASKIAAKLYEVSRKKQVLCVTHLGVIASKGDSHYLIEKSEHDGKTFTNVTLLSPEARKYEIARIIGGGNVTDLQLKNAEEMLGGV